MLITYKSDSKSFNPINFANLYNDIKTYKQRSDNFYRTYTTEITDITKLNKIYETYQVDNMKQALRNIHPLIVRLLQEDMQPLYETFHIPKATGGFRRIDAPKNDLMATQRSLKELFESKLLCITHDSAFAYVKGRSTKDAIMEHQLHQSRWFLKLDIKDFFPNCNLNLILTQLGKIFPFQFLMRDQDIKLILADCIKLCLINDKLPQGTPMSPLLTNLIMIPYDVEISHKLSYTQNQHFKYTRYADDILLSCKYNFDWRALEQELAELIAPFQIKSEKTRYGSSAGRNWNLGLMLNKDNNITIGWKKKERLRASLFKFLQDYTDNHPWSTSDTAVLLGLIAYYNRVEPKYISELIDKYNKRFNLNFKQCVTSIMSLT